MRDLSDLLEIRYVILGISNALNVHRLRLIINGVLEVLRIVSIYKFRRHAKSWQEHLQLVVGTTIPKHALDILAQQS